MFIGNLGAEPEMKYTAQGNAVTTFRLAVGRSYTDGNGAKREETEWLRVVAWNKLAELCSQYLQKGRRVYVEGRLATRSWDGTDGQKRYTTEVVAGNVLFLDSARGAKEDDWPADDIYLDDVPFT